MWVFVVWVVVVWVVVVWVVVVWVVVVVDFVRSEEMSQHLARVAYLDA